MRSWKEISSSAATLCARLSSTASMLVIQGIAKRRMTPAEFGLWAILLSINLFTNGLDMGFQFTLGIRLAALGARGRETEEECRETFLSVIFLQALIVIVDSLIVLFVFPHLPWAHWFKIADPLLAAETVRLMPIATVVMIGTLPIGLVWTVFFAYHEIKLASYLVAFSNAFQTIAFIVCVYWFRLPSLDAFSSLVLVYFGLNLIQGVVLTAYVFIRRGWRFSCIPPARMVAIIRSLARNSFYAFFHTINGILGSILGPIISGFVSGLTAAGDFLLIQKLFSFLASTHLAILSPVAPFVTRESHAGNWDAVRQRLRVCLLEVWPAFFFGLGGLVLLAHPLIIRLWAGDTIRDYRLAGLLLLWACVTGFVNTYSVFLNSLGLVKIQAILAFILILPSILLPALFSRWFGVLGIPLGMVVCSLPAIFIWPIYTRRALRLQLHRT